jgi:hypothetical protein
MCVVHASGAGNEIGVKNTKYLMTLTKTASLSGVKGNGVAGSSLFSVGEDEIQRNNQP